jgi:hypothetical protein
MKKNTKKIRPPAGIVLTAAVRRLRLLFGFAGWALLLGACAEDSWESLMTFNSEELRPPRLDRVVDAQNNVLEAYFDKDTWIDLSSLEVYPDLRVSGVEDGSPVARIFLEEGGQPGKKYTIEASVRDERGNTCSFLYQFYARNARIPSLVINEVIVASSTTVYTQVEIAVLSDGNIEGVTFFEGTMSYADKTFMFPSLEVKQGDFILLHFNTINAEGEINETAVKTEASGKGASGAAWDFWAPETGNLSKDNDVLSLYTNPGGDIIDGLLYTSKTYEPEMKYNGFGTSLMLNKAVELAGGGGWKIRADEPFPEDGFNPTGATSTRTICRDSHSTDTNSAADWHIVPDKSRTPGAANSDAVYTK